MSTPNAPPEAVIVIPARLASQRLPRKMLLRETGKSLVQHTYEQAAKSSRSRSLVVATDAEEIADDVRAFGGKVVMTSPDCQCGTDRVAEAAAQLLHADVLVNVQGDEPEIAPEAIDQVIDLLDSDPTAVMATLCTPIRDRARLEDPSCVKVVSDAAGRALYFSRSPIPRVRDWDDAWLTHEPPVFFQHLGLYAFKRSFLLQFSKLRPSLLEATEKLEQLRILEAGYTIRLGVTPHCSRGIDTPADYRAFVERRSRRSNSNDGRRALGETSDSPAP